jgi:lactate racemase
MVIGKGLTDAFLKNEDIEEFLQQAFIKWDMTGQKVLVVVPGSTRTLPMPLFFRLIHDGLAPKAKSIDYLIASGTYAPMSIEDACKIFGITPRQLSSIYKDVNIFMHRWNLPESYATLGIISEEETDSLTSGMLKAQLPVKFNRRVLDYDLIIVLEPVTPHELAGFSGGNKLFVSGIGSPEVMNFTSWLGALHSRRDITGKRDTSVRSVIDRAASFIPASRLYICPVVKEHGVSGLFIGEHNEAWESAAELSTQVHIVYAGTRYSKVIAVLPEGYPDLWAGVKGLQMVEQIVKDGGEVIIYAPHIRGLSSAHGMLLEQIGYHVRDYFMKKWDNYKGYPLMVLANSTLMKPDGRYEEGKEHPRITATLATGISPHTCKKINVNYLDPAEIKPDNLKAGQNEDLLIIPNAGEILYSFREN